MSDSAISNALQTRIKKRQVKDDANGGVGKRRQRIHKASFVIAQRKIKKDLGIQHSIESDALVSTGRCLDEATQSVIARWIAYGGKQTEDDDNKSHRVLSGPLAIQGLLSIVPADRRSEVSAFVNDSLNAFYDVCAK